MMFAVGSMDVPCQSEDISCYAWFAGPFYHEGAGVDFSHVFSPVTTEMVMCFCPFFLLIWLLVDFGSYASLAFLG